MPALKRPTAHGNKIKLAILTAILRIKNGPLWPKSRRLYYRRLWAMGQKRIFLLTWLGTKGGARPQAGPLKAAGQE